MRRAPAVDRTIGMAFYVSASDGTGGRLRDRPADFRVREIETIDPEPLDADPGRYPHLLIRATLRSWETYDFADRLSDACGISRERIGWAGTKDRTAHTTQLFSIDGGTPPLPEIEGCEIDAIGRFGRALRFGDLAGNAFRIVVRDPDRPEAAASVTEDLRGFAAGGAGDDGTVGVPNWFGPQRFGSRRPVTHRVGLRIVSGDWPGAVLTYLTERDAREPDRTQAARSFVAETRDWNAALDRFPRQLGHERALLHGLAEAGAAPEPDPATARSALDRLPSRLRRLFVHAAQSYVFNRIVSERLDRTLPFGRPVPGDVVCFADRVDGLTVPDPGRATRVDADRVDSVARHCDRGRAFVTAPLVGCETRFADGEPGEIARSVCADVGIDPSDFDLPEPYHSSGTRRAILLRPTIAVERDPLEFEFSLPKGAYATVLLREYLKDPTGL